MEFLRQTIGVIWNKLDINVWLDSMWQQNKWNESFFIDKNFVAQMVDSFNEITLDQADAIRLLTIDQWMKKKSYYSLLHEDEKKDSEGYIINVLIHFLTDILIVDKGIPKCRFSKLLRWNNVYHRVGDDMLTCAYLAHYDLSQKLTRKKFLWPTVIGHTNHEIDAICSKGLSELHFHLKGSSVNFDIQWISLMNDVIGRKKSFEILAKYTKGTSISDYDSFNSRSLFDLVILAAYIRVLLFSQYVVKDKLVNHSDDIKHKIIRFPRIYQNDIQNWIEQEKFAAYKFSKKYFEQRVIDYAISSSSINEGTIDYVNTIVCGERRILYYAFKYVYAGGQDSAMCSYLLMAYTMIKCRLRQKLIQINTRKGFENFNQYEQCKELFIKNKSIYRDLVEDLALKISACNQSIDYLEYRITPTNNVRNLIKNVTQLANISSAQKGSSYIQNAEINRCMENIQFYSIMHFIKQKFPEREYGFRDHKLRLKIKDEALTICRAYQLSKVVRKNICAFDAANSERNARAEVFAQALRFLRGELPRQEYRDSINDNTNSIGITYHVGEDFWDIIDGLRAVDETLIFLEMREGDRLGHAMVLGVNADEYYGERHMNIAMPKQVFLDNLVWFYDKLQFYNLTIPSALEKYFHDKIYEYTHQLYAALFSNKLQQIPMIDLRHAWLLRGNGIDIFGADEKYVGWNKYKNYRYNGSVSSTEANPLVRKLNWEYHWNKDKGNKMCFEKLPFCIIDLVTKLQECMRKDIERRHIAIETNLTSNLQIGEFSRYDEHPVLKFNKDFLDNDCSTSMRVSINTDDQGIFATSITNEFALMACAIEKNKDENGNQKYRPVYINRWLDNIREMAESQRFVKKDK